MKQNQIEELLSRVDFESFYRSHLKKTKKSNQGFTAICPFHDDDVRSFSVETKTNGLWKCHADTGCGGGNIFQFIQKLKGVDFAEAVEIVANFAGTSPIKSKPKSKKKPKIIDYKTMQKRAEQYHRDLPRGIRIILREERGLIDRDIDKYSIGYCKIHPKLSKAHPLFGDSFSMPVYKDKKLVNVRFHRIKKKKEFLKEGIKPEDIPPKDLPYEAGLKYPTVLYPEDQLKNDGFIITESEFDALCCKSNDLSAITRTAGAMVWPKKFNKYFKHKKVFICQDCDKAGRDGAKKIAENLSGIAKEIKVIDLGLKKREDLTDWFVTYGKSKKELLKLIKSTPVYMDPDLPGHESKEKKAIPKKELEESILDFAMSDIGNAERLVAFFGQKLAYCHEQRTWFIWSGSYWKADNMLETQNLIQRIVKQIGIAASRLGDEDDRKMWWKFCIASSNSHRIAGAITLARSDHAVAHATSDFDTNCYLLNVKNGTIDLRTGIIRPFKQSDFITKISNATYDQKAECPNWLKFLDLIMMGNQELVDFLQCAVGYSLTGSIAERVLFILYGGGDNGKTQFLNTLGELYGDYGGVCSTATLYSKRDAGGIPNDLAAQRGKRFVSATEGQEHRRLDEAAVKRVTGGDPVRARFLNKEWFDYFPEFKVWFGTNYRPIIKGTDDAIWNRIRLVPFKMKIPKEDQIKDYWRELIKELPGILNWALEGCKRWQTDGLKQPKEVQQATSEYRSDEDIAANFVKDAMITDRKAVTRTSEIYKRYQEWCKETGEYPPMKKNNLSRKLSGLGYKLNRSGGISSCCGLRVKEYETSY